MRLDSELGHRATVIHCPTGERIRQCFWADDCTHQYAVFAGVDFAAGKARLDIRQARQIVILPKWLVLIDPTDPDVEQVDAREEAQA